MSHLNRAIYALWWFGTKWHRNLNRLVGHRGKESIQLISICIMIGLSTVLWDHHARLCWSNMKYTGLWKKRCISAAVMRRKSIQKTSSMDSPCLLYRYASVKCVKGNYCWSRIIIKHIIHQMLSHTRERKRGGGGRHRDHTEERQHSSSNAVSTAGIRPTITH